MELYIFYRRSSTNVARRLAFPLGQLGISVMLPADSLGDNLMAKVVFDSITSADVTLLLLQPDILESEWIRKELFFARELNKVILAIGSSREECNSILQKYIDDEKVNDLIRFLQHVPTVYFPQFFDINSEGTADDIVQLKAFLEKHARKGSYRQLILSSALKWHEQQRNPDLLLRGSNLNNAWKWLQKAKESNYPPTSLQIAYITASKRRAGRASSVKFLNLIGLFRNDKVFISYRRDDSGIICHTIYDSLVKEFGKQTIFFDIDTIPQGADFAEFISDTLSKCSVFLAVIGSKWVDIRDATTGQKRLDDATDWVRLEVQTALQNPYITVIPVLINPARMPLPDDLPEAIQELVYRNGITMYNDHNFLRSMDKVIESVKIARSSL